MRLKQPPFLIAEVYIFSDPNAYIERHALYIDAGIYAANIVRELRTHGLASCMIYGCESSSPTQQKLRSIFSLPRSEYHILSVICGYNHPTSTLNTQYTRMPLPDLHRDHFRI